MPWIESKEDCTHPGRPNPTHLDIGRVWECPACFECWRVYQVDYDPGPCIDADGHRYGMPGIRCLRCARPKIGFEFQWVMQRTPSRPIRERVRGVRAISSTDPDGGERALGEFLYGPHLGPRP